MFFIFKLNLRANTGQQTAVSTFCQCGPKSTLKERCGHYHAFFMQYMHVHCTHAFLSKHTVDMR